MTIPRIATASDALLKTAYEEDNGATHVHNQVIALCNVQELVGTITYPVINLSTLRLGYANVANFLIAGFEAAGIRPDTPFHKNDEGRYAPLNGDDYRYMEYNTIGGGMRLIFDGKLSQLFLSCHYSTPALLRADKSPDMEKLSMLLTKYKFNQMMVRDHSDGTLWARLNDAAASEDQIAARKTQLILKSKQSPQFIAWLRNKNAGQNKETILDWYGLKI